MSKEKQCECCHEWWYDSDVKENLCPNCYDYFKQLKQQLEEKDKEIKSLIADYEKRISQEQELMSNMEHRLVEKQNTINEINKEFVQAVHDWKALCAKKDNEISKLQASYQQVKTQLAIQELNNLKEYCTKQFNLWENNYLDETYDNKDIAHAYKENNMAERLTKHNETGWVLKLDNPQNDFEARQQLMSKFKLACKKLGQLEDIMDKYNIESIELLEHIIKKGIVINSVIEDFAKEEFDKMKQDRNTWKRAAEMMGEELDMYAIKEDNNISTTQYFYQQAKTEGNDEK